MLLLDAVFRFGGCALLIVLAASSWQYRSVWPSAPYLMLTCISVGALFVGYTLPEFEPPEPLLGLMRFLDIPHLALTWLLALSICTPGFRLRKWHIFVAVAYAAPIFWPRLALYELVPSFPSWLPVYGALTSIVLIGHLLFTVVSAASLHSSEDRDRRGASFVIVIFAVTILSVISELIPDGAALDFRTAKVMAIFPALVFGAVWMLRFEAPLPQHSQEPALKRNLSPSEVSLLTKLDQHLIANEAYRNANTTIASLSEELGTSQYTLRALINGPMGYDNFNAYLNQIRVNSVCRTLADPDYASMPILTIALDNGFRSVSVFNKAFKSITGQTPSQYRALLALNA